MLTSAITTPAPQPIGPVLADWLYPGPVALYQMQIARASPPPAVFAAERPAIARAASARRSEFAAGRACARRALEALGLPAAAIPAGADRMPQWPEGIVGSISHHASTAIAVAGRAKDWTALGLDVERLDAVPAEIAALVCTKEELAVSIPERPERLDLVALTFSAKESVFKCFYPLERRFLDFLDVRICWLPHGGERDLGCFDAVFADPAIQAERAITIQGRWQIVEGTIYTSAFKKGC